MSTDNLVDVAPLVPEARESVRQLARLYVDHFGSAIIGIQVHGSALKGDVIPGCSDIDLKIYSTPGLLDAYGALPLEQALLLQRAMAQLDIAPFHYVQAYMLAVNDENVHNKRLDGYIGPVAGAYYMVYGRLPIAEASAAQLVKDAERVLGSLPGRTSEATQRLLEYSGGRLERTLRWLCTDVWPALYCTLVFQEVRAGQVDHVAGIWRLSKSAALNMLPRMELKGRLIRRFHQCLLDYYGSTARSQEDALHAIEQGILFLQATSRWYDACKENPPGNS